MIVLDTNVISAMMEKREEAAVTCWLDQQDLNALYTTAVNVHELRYGVEKMPHGRRTAKLAKDLDVVLSVLADRILPLASRRRCRLGLNRVNPRKSPRH
jgi:predicted nucleic acid-binding protein